PELSHLTSTARIPFREPDLPSVHQSTEDDSADIIASELVHGGILAERFRVPAVGFRRLRLRQPILREGTGPARNREEEDNDAKRHQQQAGASTPSGGLFWTGGRVLSGLAHLDWLE